MNDNYNKGYFCISREVLDDELFHSEPLDYGHAYIELVGLARWKDGDLYIRKVNVHGKRGCVYVSQDNLAQRWKWSKGKVIRFLKKLQECGKVELQKSNIIDCISICDYNEMQSCGTTNGTTNGTTDGTTNGTRMNKDNNKDINKNNKEKNNIPPIIPPRGEAREGSQGGSEGDGEMVTDEVMSTPHWTNAEEAAALLASFGTITSKNRKEFERAFLCANHVEEGTKLYESLIEWYQYRLENKHPYRSQMSYKKNLTELKKLSGNNTDVALSIIDQSIANGWQGLFADNGNVGSGRPSTGNWKSKYPPGFLYHQSNIDREGDKEFLEKEYGIKWEH